VYTIIESAIFAKKANELLSDKSREDLARLKKAFDDDS
jgi:hypothetical protein